MSGCALSQGCWTLRLRGRDACQSDAFNRRRCEELVAAQMICAALWGRGGGDAAPPLSLKLAAQHRVHSNPMLNMKCTDSITTSVNKKLFHRERDLPTCQQLAYLLDLDCRSTHQLHDIPCMQFTTRWQPWIMIGHLVRAAADLVLV